MTATWPQGIGPAADQQVLDIAADHALPCLVANIAWGFRREVRRSTIMQTVSAAALRLDLADGLLVDVVRAVGAAVRCDTALVYERHNETGQSTCFAAIGLAEGVVPESGPWTAPVDLHVPRIPGVVIDVPPDIVASLLDPASATGEALAVTLRTNDTRATMLVVVRSGTAVFTNGDRQLLSDLAITVGSALEIKEVRDRLQVAATTDELTGLGNRASLGASVDEVITAAEDPSGLAAIIIDLDEFKVVNDSLGHAYGDRVLQAIGARLTATTRANDRIARLGGDEFVVLTSDVDADVAVSVAERLLAAIAEPLALDGSHLVLRASAGVALRAGPLVDGRVAPVDLGSLLQGADLALYRSKANGRGRVSLYDVALRDESRRHLVIQQALRSAIHDDGLRLVYQPIVDLPTGLVRRMEALVRFDHPEFGPVPPDEFILIAERAGLIRDLDDWVLGAAASQIARWSAARPHLSCRVGVNLSSTDLRDPTYVARALGIIERAGCRPDQLTVELTESVLADRIVIETIRRLAACGIGAAIDDFGAGYSSLNLLRQLRVRTLELDRVFVADVASDPATRTIVSTVVELAHALGQGVVAEGIETVEQLRVLREIGCFGGQGYLLGRPMDATAMDAIIGRPLVDWAMLTAAP